MGISGIYASASSFTNRGNEEEQGFQIDLLIDRNDQVINLFELKFHNTGVILQKQQAKEWRYKIALFREATKTHKQIFLTYLSTFGIIPNKHSIGLINQDFSMDILFEE